MKIRDAVLGAMCVAWCIALFFTAEPEPIWDWRVIAAFTQAILSAGAIYSAWWLQSRKREADRRDAEADTRRSFKAASHLVEYEMAHVVDLARRSALAASMSTSLARGLREGDAMLRRLELGHLPSERAVQLAVSLMRRAEKAASALEMMAPLMNSNDKLPPKALERGYREFFDCRSAFLAELMTQPEKERRSPETLAAITPESPNWWEEDQTKHGQSASGTS